MAWRLRKLLPIGFGLAMLALAGQAYAACCDVPKTHQVRVPGVVVERGCGSNCCTTSCNGGGGGGNGGGGGGGFGGGGGGGFGGGVGTGGSATGGQGGQGGSVTGGFQGSTTVSVTGSLGANGQGSAFGGSSNAFGLGGAVNGSSWFGGGGRSTFYVDYTTGYIPNLAVDEGAVAAAYQASRTVVKVFAIRAVCIDDREIPHPASQVSPDQEIAETYDGELFRCLAGTRMQYTLAEYAGKISFDGGQSTTCEKGQSLYRSAEGKVECRRQKPGRDCNERSLLRRYGAGIKIVKMVWTETYTAYRQEAASASVAMGMVIDGGVGGVAH